MCDQCSKFNSHTKQAVRDTLDENDLALYIRLKQITDTRKLQALLPAYIKAHMRAVAPPKPFVFAPDAPPVFPNLFTSVTAAQKFSFPQTTESAAQYVLEFERINNLKSTQGDCNG